MSGIKDDTVKVKADLLERESIHTMAEFSNPMDLYEGLIQRVKKYHPSGDISLIEKAFNIAKEAHKNQFRKSGEPYIIHPLCVAMILAELELDKETIVAGILHDVVEDTVLTDKEITEFFGKIACNSICKGVPLMVVAFMHRKHGRLIYYKHILILINHLKGIIYGQGVAFILGDSQGDPVPCLKKVYCTGIFTVDFYTALYPLEAP